MFSIFRNLCPACQKGAVFSGIYSMNEFCAACGFRFEREPGYYLGAMVVSYTLGAFSMIPSVIALIFWLEAPWIWVVIVPSLQVILSNPLLFRWSRLAWLHLETAADLRKNS